jgi:hypothetical protein
MKIWLQELQAITTLKLWVMVLRIPINQIISTSETILHILRLLVRMFSPMVRPLSTDRNQRLHNINLPVRNLAYHLMTTQIYKGICILMEMLHMRIIKT